jgi:predicted enzyme related to lactoylglutathione lyase
MPEYPHGTPSWVELNTTDGDASASFYTQLFGWSASDAGPVEETGGYRMFLQDGKSVAGLMARDDLPHGAWATYVSVDDADSIAKKVSSAGGSTVVEPMDVMDIGRMAVFTDPTGAAFGVWQPKSFAGAELVNEPVSFCWGELLTRDQATAERFYPAVFGWTVSTMEGYENYSFWNVGGRTMAGLIQMTDEMFPPEIPSYWAVCFAVDDTDATIAKATELGATVAVPPADIPAGRFAVLLDPQGTPFEVIKLASEG